MLRLVCGQPENLVFGRSFTWHLCSAGMDWTSTGLTVLAWTKKDMTWPDMTSELLWLGGFDYLAAAQAVCLSPLTKPQPLDVLDLRSHPACLQLFAGMASTVLASTRTALTALVLTRMDSMLRGSPSECSSCWGSLTHTVWVPILAKSQHADGYVCVCVCLQGWL